MLKADRIDLAILTLVIDCPNPDGPTFRLQEFQSKLSETCGFVSDAEITAQLILLADNELLAIDKYEHTLGRFLPWDRSQGTAFFYSGPGIRCKPLPRARRRQQELASHNSRGIFISHITEEKAIARRLKQLFLDSLSPQPPVFVSSDYKSIASGDAWYQKILNGLKSSQAIILILSPNSVDRRWINYEAGIGIGQESAVMPVVWLGLSKNDVGLPLNHFFIHDLTDEEGLKALVADVAGACKVGHTLEPIAKFLENISEIASGTPVVGLEAIPVRTGRRIQLCIRNTGTKPLDLLEAELFLPQSLCAETIQEYQPVLLRKSFTIDKTKYTGKCLTRHPSTMTFLGVSALKPKLAAGVEEAPPHLGLILPERLSDEDQNQLVYYSVTAEQQVYGPKSMAIKDIPTRDE